MEGVLRPALSQRHEMQKPPHRPKVFPSRQALGPSRPPLPGLRLATFSTSCPPACLPRGCTVMTTPSVSQSWAEAPAASSAACAMPSRPCSSARSCSWDGLLLRVAGCSLRRGEASRDMGCTWPVSRLLLITERIWGGGRGGRRRHRPIPGKVERCSDHTGVTRGQSRTTKRQAEAGSGQG